MQPPASYRSVVLAADGLVKTGQGWLYGFIVNASASGVVELYDNTSATGTLLFGQTAIAKGEEYNLPVEFTTGCYFNLVSGTATVTILYI